MDFNITGVEIYYYIICIKKLWLFHYNIQMEQENENVQIGKLIDEESYSRDDKHINIDNVINIDFIRASGILHEVKKSKKIEEASIYQVKYYLYYLKKKGVEGIKGKIDYPLLKQTIEITLTEEDCVELEVMLHQIKSILSLYEPPKVEKKKICKNCAYYDLCFV